MLIQRCIWVFTLLAFMCVMAAQAMAISCMAVDSTDANCARLCAGMDEPVGHHVDHRTPTKGSTPHCMKMGCVHLGVLLSRSAVPMPLENTSTKFAFVRSTSDSVILTPDPFPPRLS